MSAASDKLANKGGMGRNDFNTKPKSTQKTKTHKLIRLSKNCCCQYSKKYTAKAPIPSAATKGINVPREEP